MWLVVTISANAVSERRGEKGSESKKPQSIVTNLKFKPASLIPKPMPVRLGQPWPSRARSAYRQKIVGLSINEHCLGSLH